MERDRPQEALWSHFQKTPEVFSGGEDRLAFLIRRIASRFHERNATILNIGTGSGYFERSARAISPNVISVDPDPGVMTRLKEAGFDARIGTFDSLPIPSARVDCVVASEVIEHLSREATEAGLQEVKRVLKRGGLFLGTVPLNEDLAQEMVFCPTCSESFHRWGHRQSFTVGSLREQLARFFRIGVVRPIYLAPWRTLNWKGRTAAALTLTLSKLGSYGHGANIFFECTAPSES